MVIQLAHPGYLGMVPLVAAGDGVPYGGVLYVGAKW